MQFDKFDKRAKEAAEHHHPTYDEQAWDKMEKLLDKHLPQKEERKRRLLFILFFFLLLGGGYFIYRGVTATSSTNRVSQHVLPPTDQEKSVTSNSNQPAEPVQVYTGPAQKDNTKPEPSQGIENISTDNDIPGVPNKSGNNPRRHPNSNSLVTADSPASEKISEKNNTTTQDRDVTSPGIIKKPDTEGTLVTKRSDRNKAGKAKRDVQSNNPVTIDDINPDQSATTSKKQSQPEANPDFKNVEEPVVVKSQDKQSGISKLTEKPVDPGPAEEKKAIVNSERKDSTNIAEPVAKKSPKKNRKKNGLYLSVSAGPDVSKVGDNKIGKTRIVTGLGLSYIIKDRFSISTGFYSARKIYTAKPADYKAPPEFYQSYPYLEKVDANCRVFEIPVTVAYHFGKKPGSNWFVSAGVSSFLMNEEGYNYYYKYTPTGNTYTNFWKVKNENAHYFTVGTLSAGYKRNIGKNFYVAAEPYLKIPFSGVGYGKVKLNSGGVLFTVGMKVF